MIIILIGVSGSGKTAVGKALSSKLNVPFFDGDDFHREANKKKMSGGIPLTDADRMPWLQALKELLETHISKQQPMILACSALKQSYRDLLNVDSSCHFVFLSGSIDLIEKRLLERKHPFFNPTLLQSQFDTLEKPRDAIVVDISCSVEKIVETILKKLFLV